MSVAAKLTKKQEAFAVAVAKGITASDAYRAAYDCKNTTAKTVHEKASRLAAGDKVRARIKALIAPVLKRHEASVARSMEEAVTIAYGEPDEPLTYGAKLKALEMLFKHFGLFKEDNGQRADNLAIQINLVGAPVSAGTRTVDVQTTLVKPNGNGHAS